MYKIAKLQKNWCFISATTPVVTGDARQHMIGWVDLS